MHFGIIYTLTTVPPFSLKNRKGKKEIRRAIIKLLFFCAGGVREPVRIEEALRLSAHASGMPGYVVAIKALGSQGDSYVDLRRAGARLIMRRYSIFVMGKRWRESK